MNNESTRVLLALFVFGSILLGLACSPSPTNQNTNSDVQPRTDISKLCPAGADFPTKKKNIEDEIKKEIVKKGLLNSQNNERFKYEIVEFGIDPNKKLELRLSGLLRDLREKGAPTVEDFLDIIDEYMDRGCIQRVTFTKSASRLGELTSEGFDWQSCEFPKVYCTDGVCRDNCDERGNTNSSNNMSNSNNSNSNNSNSNTNTNSARKN